MAHVLIIGMTESGKTSLAKLLNAEYRNKGLSSIVLDPINDPGWRPDEDCFVTRDKYRFLQTVKNSRSCVVFVDESGEIVGQYDTEMHWLGTRARHYGHSCHFLSQRTVQIATTVRDQCSTMYLFACGKKDSKILADEWNQDEITEANKLGKGEFFIVHRMKPLQYGKTELNSDGTLSVKISDNPALHTQRQGD